jgi:hypothetical protein
MSKTSLQQMTKKELTELARKRGVPNFGTMKKEELLEALTPAKRPDKQAKPPAPARQKTAARSTQAEPTVHSSDIGTSKFLVTPAPKPTIQKALPELPHTYGHDRLVVLVRDPYWLHCYWELTRQTIERAQAALEQDWHTSKPMLRVIDVTSEDTTAASEVVVRDIEIHGGTNNWYIDVQNPPRTYRVDIGYLTKGGRFYVLARSNLVSTPRPGVSDTIDENWTEVQQKLDRIFAMSLGGMTGDTALGSSMGLQERLRRPLSSPSISNVGSGNQPMSLKSRKFWFQLDAELIVYGATEPTAKVTLQEEPVPLRPDGTFTMRFSLPDSRQIIPAVAHSADGIEERTIVLAVERNTKQLEPMVHDGGEA